MMSWNVGSSFYPVKVDVPKKGVGRPPFFDRPLLADQRQLIDECSLFDPRRHAATPAQRDTFHPGTANASTR